MAYFSNRYLQLILTIPFGTWRHTSVSEVPCFHLCFSLKCKQKHASQAPQTCLRTFLSLYNPLYHITLSCSCHFLSMTCCYQTRYSLVHIAANTSHAGGLIPYNTAIAPRCAFCLHVLVTALELGADSWLPHAMHAHLSPTHHVCAAS